MADKPKTPKILEELSQGSAKAGGHSSRQQQNARRRFWVVVALFVPLIGGAVYGLPTVFATTKSRQTYQ